MSARVLVVDDEPRIGRMLDRVLDAEGFVVDVTTDGRMALRMVQEREYALVLLDLLMPNMDGFEVLGGMMRRDRNARVVVVSAVGDVDSKIRSFQMGAIDYVPKPFAMAELVARVRRRVAEERAPTSARWLEVAGVRLDLHQRVVCVSRRQVWLSQREFVLLAHLMRHADEVCGRSELMADVWGYSLDAGSNVIEVCIARLRTKLGTEHIRTVRNVGYSFLSR